MSRGSEGTASYYIYMEQNCSFAAQSAVVFFILISDMGGFGDCVQ